MLCEFGVLGFIPAFRRPGGDLDSIRGAVKSVAMSGWQFGRSAFLKLR